MERRYGFLPQLKVERNSPGHHQSVCSERQSRPCAQGANARRAPGRNDVETGAPGEVGRVACMDGQLRVSFDAEITAKAGSKGRHDPQRTAVRPTGALIPVDSDRQAPTMVLAEMQAVDHQRSHRQQQVAGVQSLAASESDGAWPKSPSYRGPEQDEGGTLDDQVDAEERPQHP